MLVSPTNVSVPLIAPSVNVQTEQAARDNKVREPVTPTVALAKSNAERKVKADDKRRRQSSWDPAEHPSYETGEQVEDVDANYLEDPQDTLNRIFQLIALESYSQDQGKGYAMRFRLPAHIIDAAITEGKMAKRRTVIKFHYGHAIAPHTPSDVIAVL
ncbi:ATP-dependent Lon protease [Vibrio ostreicida]|uniref:ATP-dependent Lon protease n=1 Tax=Vibrio ostreicida TaxID=526588 RepID=A0ABT8BVL8_9VIBR|nr:ATP-dependent Lon protease [Vibrio ostreicida]MDN3608547.1 ATP-dependent Lon protease [Vibrio ostreicida]MDN3611028.1 ATP-dependent Lon protease [Vibrio ostreicida]NPD10679.1 ATP-dependent Lon protease [Vibrio ostreicida]